MQPIEIILDSFLPGSRRGPSNHYYFISNVIAFIENSSGEYLRNRDRDELKSIIKKAFDLAKSADTNPCRLRADKIQENLLDAQEKSVETESKKDGTQKEYDVQNKELFTLKGHRNYKFTIIGGSIQNSVS